MIDIWVLVPQIWRRPDKLPYLSFFVSVPLCPALTFHVYFRPFPSCPHPLVVWCVIVGVVTLGVTFPESDQFVCCVSHLCGHPWPATLFVAILPHVTLTTLPRHSHLSIPCQPIASPCHVNPYSVPCIVTMFTRWPTMLSCPHSSNAVPCRPLSCHITEFLPCPVTQCRATSLTALLHFQMPCHITQCHATSPIVFPHSQPYYYLLCFLTLSVDTLATAMPFHFMTNFLHVGDPVIQQIYTFLTIK